MRQVRVVVGHSLATARITREAVAFHMLDATAPAPSSLAAGCVGAFTNRALASALDEPADTRRSTPPRHHLHHCAYGVGSEECALGASHDLDPIDIGDRKVRKIVAAAEIV